MAAGIRPKEIAEAVPFRESNWAERVEGEHRSDAEVLPHLGAAAKRRRVRFNPRRWHLGDEDLLVGDWCTSTS